MVKAAELRELDDDELADRLVGARKELFNLRFQLATGRLDNISRIGMVRKEIARIITLGAERTSGVPEAARSTRGASVAATADKTEEG